MTTADLRRSAVIAVSLGGLFFFRSFRTLLYPSDLRYFDAEVPRWFDYAAILACVLVVALVLFLFHTAAQRLPHPALRKISCFLFLGAGLSCFGSISFELITWIWPTASNFVNIPLPLLILAVCVILSWKKRFALPTLVDRLSSIALILLPFVGVLVLQTAYIWATGGEAPLKPTEIVAEARENPASQVRNKIVWIIFDELGYSALTHRPQDVRMPTMDDLMLNSWVAENAFPPDYDTRDSIPALLTGSPIKTAEPISNRDLLLRLENGSSGKLSESATVVSDIKQLGGNAAMVGWYLPYPRNFENTATIAFYRTLRPKTCSGVGACMADLFQDSVENVPLVNRFFGLLGIDLNRYPFYLKEQLSRNRFLREKALWVLSRPNIDLCFFHFSIPHDPFENSDDEPTRRGYFGSLEAVDRSLGDIRAALVASGGWENTALIVSGDHWWRGKSEADFTYLPEEMRKAVMQDLRVPFIVKLPGENAGIKYTRSFNTVVTRSMIDSIAKGEIRSTQELSAWMDRMAKERPELVNFRPGREGN